VPNAVVALKNEMRPSEVSSSGGLLAELEYLGLRRP
jgi:hypothetical protein